MLQLWSSFWLLVSALVTIVVIKVIIFCYNQRNYWTKEGIPNLIRELGFLTPWKLIFQRVSFTDYCNMIYKIKPEAKYVGTMDVNIPVLIIRDPEIIKDITVKNFEHFTDHRSFIDENADPVFGKNVFALRGERWKEMRNTLSPSFTASKMKFMFDLVSKCASEFADFFETRPDICKSVDSKDAFTRYTNDVIATVAFGISVNSLENRSNEFFVKGTQVSNFSGLKTMFKFLMMRFAPSLCRILKLGFVTRSTGLFFNSIVSETLALRKEKNIVRPDMIHLLMQAQSKDDSNVPRLTTDDIVAQAFIFFLAGFETSSNVMCFVAHELAVNQDIQDKLREEVDRVLEGNEINYESLLKMNYMDMVINETLRKYPAVIFIDRLCVKDFTLPPTLPGAKEYTVRKDSYVWFPVFGLHRDPKYFSDPDKFDPERFSEANKEKIIPYSYMPFGHGPRKCIGERFALMELKVLLVALLSKFVLKRTEKTQDPIVFSKSSFNLKPKLGFWISLEKRKK